MEFAKEDYGVSFTLPDRVSVRQQLAYVSTVIRAEDKEFLEKYWRAAVGLVENWKCEQIPDPTKLDLEKTTSPRIAEIVTWVGLEVRKHMNSLEDVPKN